MAEASSKGVNPAVLALFSSTPAPNESFGDSPEEKEREEWEAEEAEEEEEADTAEMDQKKKDCTLFVGNVPLSVDKKSLGRIFKEYGAIRSIRFRSVAFAFPKRKKEDKKVCLPYSAAAAAAGLCMRHCPFDACLFAGGVPGEALPPGTKHVQRLCGL